LINDLSIQLRERGIVLLRDAFRTDSLTRLKAAAERFYQAIGTERSLPEHYRYNRFSNSVLLTALMDFGCDGSEELWAPLSAPGLVQLFTEAMGTAWSCSREQSWVRKKLAPGQAAPSGYHLQGWHQDGALGVSFPLQSGPVIPMTELLTCWIPLNACGVDSPGLEFVRGRQPALLHFTELDDPALRQRFSPEEFWAPALEFGDGLIFLNDILHRTSVRQDMGRDRLSVEYRIMPGGESGQE
jgi:Phytanoyl-CoA dioxygenase (PhyH)